MPNLADGIDLQVWTVVSNTDKTVTIKQNAADSGDVCIDNNYNDDPQPNKAVLYGTHRKL